MLTFKTQFPIRENATVADLLEAVRVWLAGSPHSGLASQMKAIDVLSDGDVHTGDGETVTIASIARDDKAFCGARWENNDDEGRTWVTEVTACKRDDGFWLSVLLNVDAELPVERLEQGRRPYVLKTIMKHIGGGLDGELRVQDRPHLLEEKDVDLAARLIAADAGSRMPIVFVSATMSNRHHVDAKVLAQQLSGMAHVVVEPSRQFSRQLMRLVYSENAYGGAVAIYWPDGIGKWTFLPNYDDEQDAQAMQRAIISKVRQSLLFQRTLSDCNWSYVQDLRARHRIQELIDSGSGEVEKYIEAFDADLRARQDRIDELEDELRRLRARPAEARQTQGEKTGRAITIRTGIDDLYQGEREGLLVELLRQAFDQAEVGTRRHTVLKDFVERNQIQSEKIEIMDRIKTMMRGYKDMNASLRSNFEDMEFDIKEDGRHYKLTFRGDTRYPIIVSKTSSDHRAGLNAVSEFRRMLF